MIALAVVATGALAVYLGAGLVALALILPGLAGLVGIFLYSQRIRQMQLAEGRETFREERRRDPAELPEMVRSQQERGDSASD